MEDITFSYVLYTWIIPILRVIAVLFAGYILARIASKIIIKTCEKKHLDVSLGKFLSSASRITIMVITVIAILSLLGIPTTGIVAAFSAAAVAVSLALKDSLSNISGGIFLLVTRPFVTGNFINVSGDLGTVKEIKLVHTVLRTPDGKEIIIPNSVLMSSTITNFSNEDKRRVDLVFTISYDSDVELARKIILDAAYNHSATLKEPAEPFARVTEHDASAIKITARIWCLSCNFLSLQLDMLDTVRNEFNANGIKIPFNQLDVHIDGKLDK